MPADPHDPSGHLDPESEKWWQELTWLDEADREQLAQRTSQDREFERAARRRARRGRRSRGGAPFRGHAKASRSVLTFVALLLVAAGVITIAERGWEQAREASFAEGGHLDGTTIQGEDGTYAFLATRGAVKAPVTYEPCRTVEVEINSSGEVPGGSELVLEAMDRVSELSGIELAYAGPSTERPDRWSEQMDGARLASNPPVLVSWSDEDETPGLEGDVVGLGGSISLRGGSVARERYVTGSVTLDGPDLAEIAENDDGEAQVRAVILHEFGHLVGLGHVADPRELMSESNSGQLDFGPGDREGLARLGATSC